jgi:hypothetical protein
MENAAVGASMRSTMFSEALTAAVATTHVLIFGGRDNSNINVDPVSHVAGSALHGRQARCRPTRR